MTEHPLTLLVAFVLGTIAVARGTRLVTSDAYPPMAWLRDRWVDWAGARTATQNWAPLLTCPFCFAPYAAAVDMAWFLLADAHHVDGSGWSWAWWLANAWAAVSYLAAMLVVRDEPPEE